MKARKDSPPSLARIESNLGVAHRALLRARLEAECLVDQGLADDLFQLQMELGRLWDGKPLTAARRASQLSIRT